METTSNNRTDIVTDFFADNMVITINNGQPTHINYSKSRKLSDDNCYSDHLLILLETKEETIIDKEKVITNYK